MRRARKDSFDMAKSMDKVSTESIGRTLLAALSLLLRLPLPVAINIVFLYGWVLTYSQELAVIDSSLKTIGTAAATLITAAFDLAFSATLTLASLSINLLSSDKRTHCYGNTFSGGDSSLVCL